MRIKSFAVLSAAMLTAACGTQGGKKSAGSEPPPVTGADAPGAGDPGPAQEEGARPAPDRPTGKPSAQDPKQPPSQDSDTPAAPPPAAPTTPPPAAPPANPYGQHVDATESGIQSLLVNHYCLPCHRGTEAAAGLDLTDIGVYATGEPGAGGYRGTFIYPGQPDISAFKLVLKDHQGVQSMPPADNSLGIPAVLPQQIDAVSAWIQGLDEGPGPGRP